MMTNSTLLSSLDGITSGEISPGKFADSVGMSTDSAIDIMEWWHQQGVGRYNGVAYTYNAGSRLEAGIILIRQGLSIHDIARQLDWRDFEGLTGRILESEGFDVQYNFMMKNPRSEIDVIGIRMNIALLVDCKHWRRDVPHTVAAKQIMRTEQWSALYKMTAVPVIVTIHQERNTISEVPIIPISKFRSFTEDFFGNLEHIKSIR